MLIEMAADLEALFEHYLARGLPEEEAALRAEERILASPAEVQRLVELHSSGAQRWLGWAAGRLRRDLDAFLFLAGVLPVLALAAGILLPGAVIRRSDPFFWALLAIGAGVAVLCGHKLRQFAPGREAGLEELRAGLPSVLFLAGIGPAVAALGFLVRLCSLALGLSVGGPGDPDWSAVAAEIGHAATLLGTGILLGMASAILWLVLANRVAALERIEREILLGD